MDRYMFKTLRFFKCIKHDVEIIILQLLIVNNVFSRNDLCFFRSVLTT